MNLTTSKFFCSTENITECEVFPKAKITKRLISRNSRNSCKSLRKKTKQKTGNIIETAQGYEQALLQKRTLRD